MSSGPFEAAGHPIPPPFEETSVPEIPCGRTTFIDLSGAALGSGLRSSHQIGHMRSNTDVHLAVQSGSWFIVQNLDSK